MNYSFDPYIYRGLIEPDREFRDNKAARLSVGLKENQKRLQSALQTDTRYQADCDY